MLILINILILDMVLDQIHVHFFLISNFDFGKNVIIFCVENSSSTDTDQRKKHILVLGEGPTDALHNATIVAEVKYSINFTES